MYVFAPVPHSIMFFNVDASVGHLGANSNQEDILLVQYLLKKAGERDSGKLSQDRRARLHKVQTTGVSDPATIDAIKAVQEHMRDARHRGTVVDGRVSPARGHDYGGGQWTIVTLNFQVALMFSEVYPRLDFMGDCPAPLATRIVEIFSTSKP